MNISLHTRKLIEESRQGYLALAAEHPYMRSNFVLQNQKDFPIEKIHEQMRPRNYLPPIESRLVSSSELGRRWKGKAQDRIFVHCILKILGCYVDIGYRYIKYWIDEAGELQISTLETARRIEINDSYTVLGKTIPYFTQYDIMRQEYLSHLSIVPIESTYAEPLPKTEVTSDSVPGIYENFLTGQEWQQTLLLTNKANMIGFFQDPLSDILAVDIDDHANSGPISQRAQLTLKYLLKYLGFPTPVFLERSLENGGYHAYFVLQHAPSHQQLLHIQDTFNALHKDKELRIECRTLTKALRMILSCTYMAVLIQNLEELRAAPDEISLENCNIIEDILPTISDAFLSILSHDAKPAPFSIPSTSGLTTMNAVDHLSPGISHANPQRQTYQRLLSSEEGQLGQGAKTYPMEAGNRNKQMIRLAYAIIGKGGTLDDYVEEVLRNQVSSKDIAVWSRAQLYNHCKGKWQWAQKHFKPLPERRPRKSPAFRPTISSEQEQQMRECAVTLIMHSHAFKRKSRQERAIDDMTKLIRRIYVHAGVSIAATHDERLEFRFSTLTVREAGKAENIRNPTRLFDILMRSKCMFYQHWKDEKGYKYSIDPAFCQSRQYRLYRDKEPSDLQTAHENALRIFWELLHEKASLLEVMCNNLVARYPSLCGPGPEKQIKRAYYDEYNATLEDGDLRSVQAIIQAKYSQPFQVSERRDAHNSRNAK
ncbi:MAG: hypothetical protein ACOY5B_08400 [Spirochaetota bacterium]